MRSSDSHGSPIGSSCRLASANFGSPFGFASASSSPSCSLASTSSNPSCSLASTVADKSTETEPQVLSFMQIMSDMDAVAMSVPEPETQTELGGQKNEHAGEEKAHFEHAGVEDQVTETETLLKCEAPTSVHSNKVTPMLEYNLAGQLFEDGRHRQGTGFDEKFEDVGGFSVLKPQVPLYEQIWLKYGHIASSQVLMDLYSAQVSVVTDIMNSVLDMNKQRVSELSSEMIEAWEKKIKMAEKLEFNISWLRKRFDLVKEDFYGVQKLQTALVEHDQAKARLVAAEQQLMFANNEMKKARENLSVLEARLTPLLIQKKMYEEKSTRLVLDGLL
ncbi:hypothetical protein MKW94_018363 [Papaver nudicaule]|uniref:Uncharacterized protein n=1 Tax=Papaver nudicaule TaxID=74823 RepID=A0AA42B5R7_PAPNU|nr:hypothetical protein [Papaver nudicaule]